VDVRAAALLIACASCAAPPPAPRAPVRPPAAEVHVSGGDCLAAADLEARVRHVIVDHHAAASGLVVDVVPVPAVVGTDVELRIARPTGEVGLDRHYALAAADCPSAPELIALGVDRWLSEFPEWADPPPPSPPPRATPARWFELSLGGAASSLWLPVGVDAQIAALADWGASTDRFGATLLVRGSVPEHAGHGRFQQTSALAGLAWHHRAGAWDTRLELRGGVVLVSGLGFSEDHHAWLPWWEGAVFGGRAFGRVTLGLELAATALRDHAVTRDGSVSEDVPYLRIGISGSFALIP
jgi:hypothetical protein